MCVFVHPRILSIRLLRVPKNVDWSFSYLHKLMSYKKRIEIKQI